MRIEKIELIGFKSFAEKITFHLHPGITCIVGPNGSGKSNIVDSFKWVLGEQSAKSLRGEKMEEVIFSGSATKKSRGMAEVNLIVSFDSNEDGNGNSANHTVVSRRLYRSGESEYMLNRDQCRLKDIRDLFLDTGLEIKSYSILEQGRIGEIINSKPLDRRFLIEEVAGVMKYKIRRTEALSKLESSRANLQRINDIAAEKRKQLNALDRQAKKAERYKKLSAEMRDIELRMAKRDYAGLQESLAGILSLHSSLKDEEAVIRADLNKAENSAETKKISLVEKEKAFELLVAEIQGLEREIAEAQRLIDVSAAKSANLKEYMGKLNQQEVDLVRKLGDMKQRNEDISLVEASLLRDADSLRSELSEGNEAINALEAEVAEKERLIESRRRDVFRIAEEMSRVRNEISRITASAESLEKKHASVSAESESAGSHIAEVETSIKAADLALAEYHNNLLLLNEEKNVLEADINAEASKLEEIRDGISKMREELVSADSRLRSLMEIAREDFSKEAFEGDLQVIASLAEIISVDEMYEKAVESVLSEKVKGFILLSREDVGKAASALRGRGISRTVFLSLDAFAGSLDNTAEADIITGMDALFGRASDLVKVQAGKDMLLPVIRRLLNNVYVVKDLSTAFSLLSDYGRTFVTIDGEVVEPSGAVTVGEGKGILKRQREMRDLEMLVEQKKAEAARLEAAYKHNDGLFQEKKGSVKAIESRIIETEKELSLFSLKVENHRGEQERISKKMSWLNIEAEEIRKETESLKELSGEKKAGLERLDAGRIENEDAIALAQDGISMVRERYETGRARLMDLRLSLNSCKERLEAAGKERETLAGTMSEISKTQEHLAEEKADTDIRIVRCDEDMFRDKETLSSLVFRADNLRKVMSDNREIIRNEAEELRLFEQEMKTLRNRLDSTLARVSEQEVAVAEHRLRIENLAENVRLNYGIDIHDFEAELPLPEEQERLAELRGKIQELGPVNLGTLEEYEELMTSHEFYIKQQDDLNKSIAELEEAIARINSTTKKKLRESFDLLNAKFSEVFVLLFGGGKAGLVMTDENNILESGIDIVAQPPGKKLQNIHLLSGGEKALTALSLLFASFLIKPSPLCILDEVDAPLDDFNVERFTKMLRELSSGIQFIVVTHNRVTMEAADYIYGVTMEEKGVSRIISMKLTDSEQAAV